MMIQALEFLDWNCITKYSTKIKMQASNVCFNLINKYLEMVMNLACLYSVGKSA